MRPFKNTGKKSASGKGKYGRSSYGGEKPRFSHKEDSNENKSYEKRDNEERGEKRSYAKKSYGDKKPFGEKRSYEKRGEKDGEKRPYERKSYGDKKPFGEKRSYEKRGEEGGEKRPYERKSYGDKKPFGEKRSYEKRGEEGGEKRPYERKSYGDKKPFGEKRSYEKRGEEGGEKRPYERKSYGDKKPFGEKRSYEKRGEEGGEKRPYERKSYGEKKPFVKKRSDDSSSYEKRDSGDRYDTKNSNYGKPFKKKPYERAEGPATERVFKKPYGTNKYAKKNKPVEELKVSDGKTRLNKYLSNAGICSRREADDLIKAGAVTVNGKVVSELGYKISPGDVVNYGGGVVKTEKKVYLLLNKPKDYITTVDDPHAKRTVMELIKDAGRERVYPVGRLDRNTTGVLLFTNDGELTAKLTHPKHEIKKIYQVSLNMNLRGEDYAHIQDGVELEDGLIKVDEISFVGDGKDRKEVGIQIHSGRNRIVRRIFEHLGYEVLKLDRVLFGGLTKKDLPRGRWRFLSEKEVGFLKML